jgi:hypothetical protein
VRDQTNYSQLFYSRQKSHDHLIRPSWTRTSRPSCMRRREWSIHHILGKKESYTMSSIPDQRYHPSTGQFAANRGGSSSNPFVLHVMLLLTTSKVALANVRESVVIG